ncbi:ATP-binding cassette domain-containing protein [Devosia faecipullorum]|uniref:ATP-binding cassette domain-containing protein n=1 Tax=Devosia faecipullorum TaxID=2755039 RepID=UPI00187B29A1|nr:ABC transporter ATP-binding protein [Devosia faecipullorum]MBE7732873.1 ABC transporter ATP-binding protein [Devosia faecipullorum]
MNLWENQKDAPPGASPLLEIEGLSVCAGRQTILDSISLAVSAGRTTGIVGESGSGKSMTALSILGMLPAALRRTQGSIRFEGKDLTTMAPDSLRELRGAAIAMVFQDPLAALDPVMRIDDQVGEILRKRQGLSRSAARARAVELLERVDLPEPQLKARMYPHQLSGGQRQRVVIAMALAGRPRLILADEPTTALDVSVQAKVLDLLRRLQTEDGLGMILISHDLRVMSHYADDLVVMRNGQVVETGLAPQVLANPSHDYTRHLVANVPTVHRRMLGEAS